MSIFFIRDDFKGYIRKHPVSSVLILINTIVFILTRVEHLIFPYEFDDYRYILYNFAIASEPFFYGEYYRALTAMFVHYDPFHFLFNTFFGILILSAGLEKLIGSLKFSFVFFISGLFSSLMVVAFKHAAIGASGGIYGVLGLFLYIILKRREMISYTDQSYLRNLIIINLIVTFLYPVISIEGHLGGLLAGFGAGFLVLQSNRNRYHLNN